MAPEVQPTSTRRSTRSWVKEKEEVLVPGLDAPYYTPPVECQIFGLPNELLDDICERVLDEELARALQRHEENKELLPLVRGHGAQARPESDRDLKAYGRDVGKALIRFSACKQLYAIAVKTFERRTTHKIYARGIEQQDTMRQNAIRLTGSLGFHHLLLKHTKVIHLEIFETMPQFRPGWGANAASICEQVHRVVKRCSALTEIRVEHIGCRASDPHQEGCKNGLTETAKQIEGQTGRKIDLQFLGWTQPPQEDSDDSDDSDDSE